MAETAATGLGIFASILGLVSSITGLVGDDGGPTAQVYIRSGNTKVDRGLGGTLNEVWGFDTSNVLSGNTGEVEVGPGGEAVVSIDQSDDSVQIQYLDLIGGKDAVCVAWIQMNTQGLKTSWSGDWGRYCTCGDSEYFTWHHQSSVMGFHKGKPYRPACTWVSKEPDKKGALEFNSLKMDMFANTPKSKKQVKKTTNGHWCGSTIGAKKISHPITVPPNPKQGCFVDDARTLETMSPDSLTTTNGTASLLFARSPDFHVRPRHDKFTKQVIRSHMDSHRDGAAALCLSSNSYGSDFVDPDGIYCDMAEKKLYPLCEVHEDEPGCMDYKDLDDGSVEFYLRDKNGSGTLFRRFEVGWDRWAEDSE